MIDPSDVSVGRAITTSGADEQAIPEEQFPGPGCSSELRVWISPEAHEQILNHANSDTSVEVCGVLAGHVAQDALGPFVVVEDIIRGANTTNARSRVTFTQETWASIFEEIDRTQDDKRIVGWYHTHPGFGVFLSAMDLFIQEGFFNLPWQIAFVTDPVLDDEGLFRRSEGGEVAALAYWVGDELRLTKGARTMHGQEAVDEDHEEPSAGVRPEPVPACAKQSDWRLKWNILQLVLLLLILTVVLFRPQVERALRDLFAPPTSDANKSGG